MDNLTFLVTLCFDFSNAMDLQIIETCFLPLYESFQSGAQFNDDAVYQYTSYISPWHYVFIL